LLEGLFGVFERGSCKAPDIDKERVRDLHVPLPGSTCLQVVRSDREHAVATFFGKIARAPVRDVRRGTSECDNPDLSIHCPAGVCEAICLEGSALRAADDRAVVALLPLQDETEQNLSLMRLIDVLYRDTPSATRRPSGSTNFSGHHCMLACPAADSVMRRMIPRGAD
jgi:hypothetical protein